MCTGDSIFGSVKDFLHKHIPRIVQRQNQMCLKYLAPIFFILDIFLDGVLEIFDS